MFEAAFSSYCDAMRCDATAELKRQCVWGHTTPPCLRRLPRSDGSPPPERSAAGSRTILRHIVEARSFEMTVTFVIVLNTVVLAVSHEGEPKALTATLVYVKRIVVAQIVRFSLGL